MPRTFSMFWYLQSYKNISTFSAVSTRSDLNIRKKELCLLNGHLVTKCKNQTFRQESYNDKLWIGLELFFFLALLSF